MIAAILTAWLLHWGTPHPLDFTVETQRGRIGRLSPDDRAWIDRAQSVADVRGEAVAVCQQGKLVVLLNPR